MVLEDISRAEAARTASPETIPELLGSSNTDVLRALIDNPALDEAHVSLLLQRRELSSSLLEEISKRKTWRGSYRVRLGLAAHPHTPRLIAMRLLRDLHLMDLARISLLPAISMELRRLADERVLAQLPQLPLGQKLMLARRGSGRVAAGLLSEGTAQVMRACLDNAFLTEAHLLRVLAKDSLSARVVGAVAAHAKWSVLINVRVAILRHPRAPADRLPGLVSGLPRNEIQNLLGLARLPEHVRTQLHRELAGRKRG